MKSLREQIEAMRVRWPDFRPYCAPNNEVSWRGTVVPQQQPYELLVHYGLPRPRTLIEMIRAGYGWLPFLNEMHRLFPMVRVINPPLQPNPDAEEEAPLPHVYMYDLAPQLSPLCLFDPARGEWSHDCLIAETTLLWACEWLACYEVWQVTGRWVGGGRHD